MTRRSIALLIVALAASGCASTGKFPSLLPRDVEQRSDAEPVRLAPPLVPDPALDASIAAAEKRFADGAGKFAQAADAAARAVAPARGAAKGSESWLTAESALGELDTAHAEIVGLAAELDAAAIARASGGDPAYPALEDLRRRIEAEIAAEARRIDALHDGVTPA